MTQTKTISTDNKTDNSTRFPSIFVNRFPLLKCVCMIQLLCFCWSRISSSLECLITTVIDFMLIVKPGKGKVYANAFC